MEMASSQLILVEDTATHKKGDFYSRGRNICGCRVLMKKSRLNRELLISGYNGVAFNVYGTKI